MQTIGMYAENGYVSILELLGIKTKGGRGNWQGKEHWHLSPNKKGANALEDRSGQLDNILELFSTVTKRYRDSEAVFQAVD